MATCLWSILIPTFFVCCYSELQIDGTTTSFGRTGRFSASDAVVHMTMSTGLVNQLIKSYENCHIKVVVLRNRQCLTAWDDPGFCARSIALAVFVCSTNKLCITLIGPFRFWKFDRDMARRWFLGLWNCLRWLTLDRHDIYLFCIFHRSCNTSHQVSVSHCGTRRSFLTPSLKRLIGYGTFLSVSC